MTQLARIASLALPTLVAAAGERALMHFREFFGRRSPRGPSADHCAALGG
jgi:hypothetical protein